jgi:PAS domain
VTDGNFPFLPLVKLDLYCPGAKDHHRPIHFNSKYSADRSPTMSIEDDVSTLIDLIYEAAFDSTLWPTALIRLADTMGAAQIGLLSLDRAARKFDSLAPRCDPVMDAIFKKYWAFHNPLWPLTIVRPVREIFWTDSLIPRKDFVASPFFNEWMRPAKFGAAAIGANLLVGNEVSSMITVGNAPGKDEITAEQTHVFEAVLGHVHRAVKIHRMLQLHDLDHDTAPDQLEQLPQGVMLVDGVARVLFANAAARRMFDSGGRLALKAGFLQIADGSDVVQGLIATCTCKVIAPNGPGGEISIPRSPSHPPLRVTVTPLRTRGTVAELPWLGLDIPVAIVAVVD